MHGTIKMKTAKKREPSDQEQTTQIRVFIVDDHAVVRHGLTQRLDLESDMEVCGEASTAHEALKEMNTTVPDVVLVDLSLDDGNGLDLIKDIKSRGDQTRVLVVSGHDESAYAERCVRAGAHGYLHKKEAVDEIVDAIRTVAADNVYLSDATAARTLRRVLSGKVDPDASPLDTLSDRELQVYELIGQGLTVNEIADKLFLSPKTIETYRAHLKEKLNLKNSNELARSAMQWVLENA